VVIAYLNGWLEFLIGVPIFLGVMLVIGLLIAYASEKEMERHVRKFKETHGRAPDPNDPADWPEPPSMWP
jgi:hypothetical protein